MSTSISNRDADPMPSNALSQKSFNTATPAICHPPPWPPIVIPPPIPKAAFFVFGTINHPTGSIPMVFAASCKLTLVPKTDYWHGTSSNDPNVLRIIATLWRIPLEPDWTLRVIYKGEGIYGHIINWYNQTFPPARPYVAPTLHATLPSENDPVTANLREIPA